MKNIFMIFSILILLNPNSFSQNKNEISKLKDYLAEMAYIGKDNYVSRTQFPIILTKNDSLFINTIPQRIFISDFMISNHEVTNSDYKQFVNWVKDSIKKANNSDLSPTSINYTYKNANGEKTTINIYPDTNTWVNEFKYSYNEPMLDYYANEKYSNYPVVGVSYDQTIAYIDWLNRKLKVFLKNNNFNNTFCKYNLPSETEWQYAAFCRPSEKREDDNYKNVYPWKGQRLFGNDGKYLANFGPIWDINNIYIKTWDEDGSLFTSPIRSYSANFFRLFDMAGNVSEWVSDTIKTEEYNNYLQRTIKASFANFLDSSIVELVSDQLLSKNTNWNIIKELINDTGYYNEFKSSIDEIKKDIAIINRYDRPGIVKGGSWADSPVYLQSCSRQVFPKSKSSCRIGFRVAMKISPEMKQYIK